jgi:hypothetical protein
MRLSKTDFAEAKRMAERLLGRPLASHKMAKHIARRMSQKKPRAIVAARVISIRPSPQAAGPDRRHIISMEVENQIIDYAIDNRSASLLFSPDPYVRNVQSSGWVGTPILEASKSRF